jgi:hypothetical protein
MVALSAVRRRVAANNKFDQMSEMATPRKPNAKRGRPLGAVYRELDDGARRLIDLTFNTLNLTTGGIPYCVTVRLLPQAAGSRCNAPQRTEANVSSSDSVS